MTVLLPLLLLAFGILQLLFGYLLFRWLVTALGAMLGFAFGPQLATALVTAPTPPWLGLAAALAGALLFGLLAWFAFRLAVFLWGFGFGYGLVAAPTGEIVFALIAGLVVGGLALLFQRLVIIVLTSLSGAGLVVFAAMALLGGPLPAGVTPRTLDPLTVQPWLGLVVLVLAAAGAVAQFRRPEASYRTRR